MSILARVSPVLLLLLLVAATASARTLAEEGASNDDPAALIEASQSHPVSVGPDCETYIKEGVVKGCKPYKITHPRQTLGTIAEKFHVPIEILRAINPQVNSAKERVYTGWIVNILSDAHKD